MTEFVDNENDMFHVLQVSAVISARYAVGENQVKVLLDIFHLLVQVMYKYELVSAEKILEWIT